MLSAPPEKELPETSVDGPDRTNALIALNNGKVKIPGDTVNAATADLADHQRSAIRRLHGYYITNDLSLDDLAHKLRLSGPTLSLVFRGQYGAKLDNIVKEIETFLELEERRGQARKLPFIQTELSGKIFQLCTTAVEFNKWGFIFGDGQVGKSAALKEFQRTHNHGNTIYVEMPVGGALTHFLAKLAEKLRISFQQRQNQLRSRIIKAFDDRMLLIVDEAHRCTREGSGTYYGHQTIDFIKELFNETNCGVVISATNVFREEMEHGANSKFFEQIRRRRLGYLQLKEFPSQKDLNAFSAAYGLPQSAGASRELEKQMIADDALGMWLTLLRFGAKIAALRKKPMTWDHVHAAKAGLKELEGA